MVTALISTPPGSLETILLEPQHSTHLDAAAEQDVDTFTLDKVGRLLDSEPDPPDFGLDQLGRAAGSSARAYRTRLHGRIAVDLRQDLLGGRDIAAFGRRVEVKKARLEIGQGVGFGVGVARDLARVAVRQDESDG